MTAHEWDTCTDIAEMLDSVRDRATDRKFYLFVAGCYRAVSQSAPQYAPLVETYERYAENPKDHVAPASIVGNILQAITSVPLLAFGLKTSEFFALSGNPAYATARRAAFALNILHPYFEGAATQSVVVQADILRELLGNPFEPVEFDPRWRTETALGLAHGIYDDQAWDRMPILADALQDAGCEDERILTHCRDAGQKHHRGCWVIDEVLEPTS